MKKRQLTELIRRSAIKNGVGTADDIGRISLRQMELEIDKVYADAVALVVRDGQSLDYCTKTYNDVDIALDRTENVYYSSLPAVVLQLPQNKGVRQIKGTGTSRKFYPVTYEDVDTFEDMDIATHYDRTLYTLSGNDKVIYKNYSYDQHNIRSVTMKLIVRFTEFGWDEEISIPSGKSVEFADIVAKVIFQGKKFLDTSSDGQST